MTTRASFNPFSAAPLVVVVSFERLAAAALGPYGNQWVETPHLDRLVMEGVLFERLISHDPDLGTTPAWWSKGLQLLEASALAGQANRCRLFVEKESQFAQKNLLEKQPALLNSQVEFVSGVDGLDVAPSQFPFPKLISCGVEWLKQLDSRIDPSGGPKDDDQGAKPHWLWLHSRGIPKPWLPPEELADLYFGDFEDQGWALEEIDSSEWGELWPVYGSYASLIDHALGVLVEELRVLAATRPVQLLLFAAAGELIESIHPGSERIQGLEVMSFRPPLIYWESGCEFNIPKEQGPLASAQNVEACSGAVFPAGSRWSMLLNEDDVAVTIERFLRKNHHSLPTLQDYAEEKFPCREHVIWQATARQWRGVVTPGYVYLSSQAQEDSQGIGEGLTNSPNDQIREQPWSDPIRRPLDTELERLHLLPDDPWLLLNEAAQSQDLVFEMRQILEGQTPAGAGNLSE
ncbi:hypothetical protein [Planctopirus hydrillae]|nr:hypothetical protein [Planctopirus hydrillae]